MPGHCEAATTDRMVRAEPEVQRIVGAEEFGWGSSAAVFPDHVSRGALAIVDLQEIEVAAGAVLDVKEREGNPQNLGKTTDYCPQERTKHKV